MHFLQSDLERAKELLKEKHYTCVLCKDAQCVISKEHGVKPLLAFLNSGESYADFSAADQIVGQAAAHLYLLIGVSAVYADVISKGAIQLLTEHHIPVEHGTVVDQIRNRAGNDLKKSQLSMISQMMILKNVLAQMKASTFFQSYILFLQFFSMRRSITKCCNSN